MAGLQPARLRLDDASDIDEWMALRRADLAAHDGGANWAGRTAWARSTRTGGNLLAARPADVVTLGPEPFQMELKPNTPSGRRAAAKAVKKYEKLTGVKTRAIFYDPKPFI